MFGDAGLGIGLVTPHAVSEADADRYDHLESGGEASDAIDCLPRPNGKGINVFNVHSYEDCGEPQGGRSPEPGTCSDDGLVVATSDPANLVHELGHFFGLEHHQDEDKQDDPMFQGIAARATSRFSAEQRQVLHSHGSCFWPGCQ